LGRFWSRVTPPWRRVRRALEYIGLVPENQAHPIGNVERFVDAQLRIRAQYRRKRFEVRKIRVERAAVRCEQLHQLLRRAGVLRHEEAIARRFDIGVGIRAVLEQQLDDVEMLSAASQSDARLPAERSRG